MQRSVTERSRERERERETHTHTDQGETERQADGRKIKAAVLIQRSVFMSKRHKQGVRYGPEL